jgi:sugar/nucleoside kinase (ribokinase family)
VDTTGAGDVFHGAFIYGLLAGWEMRRILDFANAMAALNCTALGARGGIKTQAETEKLIATGARRVNRAYVRE